MAEVTGYSVWFAAVSVIFHPLTGKNGPATFVSSDVIYQTRETVFHWISKHREES